MKRLFFIVFFTLIFEQTMFAQISVIRAYIERYNSIALKHEKKYGVPASITLAQGILESGAGTSGLARASNNHFGIKRGNSWSGPCVYFWDDDPQKSAFRKYDSVEDSYEDHARFLKNSSRYRELFNKSVFDYRGWANGLQRLGYATSKTYAKALIGYIDAYQLYSINGGVKLRPGKKTVITRTVTVEELIDDPEISMDDVERSVEEDELETIVKRNGFIVDINDVRCTVLYPGEVLSSIAMKYNIPIKKLLDYNESTSEKDFEEGDIVFLEKKKKKFYGARDEYRVRKGESLYMISQKFGIQLSHLSRMNDISVFSSLSEGQKLKLK